MNRDLFVADNGDLMDLSSGEVVRKRFKFTHTRIKDTHQLRATLRAGEFVWPGGYRLAFFTRDGGILSFDAVRDNYGLISESIRIECDDGWWVAACSTLEGFEHPIYCDHTGVLLHNPEEGEESRD